MRTTEVRILGDEDFTKRLQEMRVWLDVHRYDPSRFTYFCVDPGMVVRVLFTVDAEAEAFASEFGGSPLAYRAADQLPYPAP